VVKKSAVPQENLTANAQESGFPVPLSTEQFHDDVVTLFLHQIRQIAWLTDRNKAWLITGKVPADSSSLFDPELSSGDAGLVYADIQETPFAQYLENMYQYAYFGVLDESLEPMEYETGYTWMASLLYDMNRSMFMVEWESYGGDGKHSAARCLTVAELANARMVLEGKEGFSHFSGASQREDDTTSWVDALTIRQMALLAGMEEMSIRAAANPKRANPLPTFSEEGRTRIAISDAKAWLQSKGRYVPVTRRWTRKEIDFTTRRFSSFPDMLGIVMDRRADLMRQEGTSDDFFNTFADLFSRYGLNAEEPRTCFAHQQYVHDLAEVLRFPIELFCLRVRELLAKEESDAVKRALQELALQSAE
jgi:hypothetical protein